MLLPGDAEEQTEQRLLARLKNILDIPEETGKRSPRKTITLVAAGIVGAYKGLNSGGGPSGVGRAVNESVIVAFMMLFFLNAVITAIYFQVVPQNGL